MCSYLFSLSLINKLTLKGVNQQTKQGFMACESGIFYRVHWFFWVDDQYFDNRCKFHSNSLLSMHDIGWILFGLDRLLFPEKKQLSNVNNVLICNFWLDERCYNTNIICNGQQTWVQPCFVHLVYFKKFMLQKNIRHLSNSSVMN